MPSSDSPSRFKMEGDAHMTGGFTITPVATGPAEVKGAIQKPGNGTHPRDEAKGEPDTAHKSTKASEGLLQSEKNDEAKPPVQSAAIGPSKAQEFPSPSASSLSPLTSPGLAHNFRMQIKPQPQGRKRKRNRTNPFNAIESSPSMSLSGSSDSSSEDEDDRELSRSMASGGGTPLTVDDMGATGPLHKRIESTSPQGSNPDNGIARGASVVDSEKPNAQHSEAKIIGPQSQGTQPDERTLVQNQLQQQHIDDQLIIPHQTEGWRVKLYRLNADGSWDDCGTGRIMCLYKTAMTPDSESPSESPPEVGSPAPVVENWIYQEMGDPTLCMQSENAAVVADSGPSQRILLRTRILLREAYQRQGDNIITWSEPYLEEGNSSQGVDLALSFQDNAGCLDIWRQITQVQSKSAILYRQATDGDQLPNPISNHVALGGDAELNNNESDNMDTDSGARSDGPNIIRMSEEQANGNSVEDVAHAVAAAHHANLQRQQQQEMWVNVASEAAHNKNSVHEDGFDHHHHHHEPHNQHLEHHQFEEVYHHDGGQGMGVVSTQLPNPPTLATLEEVADVIAAVQHMQQRETLTLFISQDDSAYLKSLLSLFPAAEEGGDFASLATLAACVKTILLLNDPAIIDLIVSDEKMFEEVCATLEYDPDLRDKANHRWFLRERMKFRTVVPMEDEELISAIHRSFRVVFLRDTLLRPTMDESSLSTLSSLQSFTHTDVVKGITMSTFESDDRSELLKDSYLAKVMRVLGRELHAISCLEWEQLEKAQDDDIESVLSPVEDDVVQDRSTVVPSKRIPGQNSPSIWKQYLAPQDDSLSSRRSRCRGCLSFLRELFTMVRISLQQADKDDFFAVLVSMEVKLVDTPSPETTAVSEGDQNDSPVEGKSPQENAADKPTKNGRKESDTQTAPLPKPSTWESTLPTHTNLLAMLCAFLSNPSTDVSDKGSVLDIIVGIAMHDPGLIRQKCLHYFSTRKDKENKNPMNQGVFNVSSRPNPNPFKQVVFWCLPGDLLMSLLFLLATETDAGVMLQVAEIMRVLLDTDTTGEHGIGLLDNPEMGSTDHNLSGLTTLEQNKFLSMFYEHYLQWLAVPFQYKILHPTRIIPYEKMCGEPKSRLVSRLLQNFERGEADGEPLLRVVANSATRSSFAVELLSFCVRVHIFRMKSYLLRSRLLSSVLEVLKPTSVSTSTSGDRCLKLSALRFLRSVLSVNDEFYHRHIIQHKLFDPVFEGFRSNPVGDNLVSSAVVEMCDYIHSENIKPLVEHIVTVHLSDRAVELQSLEDVSSPYVSTLTTLRSTYENNLKEIELKKQEMSNNAHENGVGNNNFDSADASVNPTASTNQKVLEDQRKFRQIDEEESYFDVDECDTGPVLSGTNDNIPLDEVRDHDLEGSGSGSEMPAGESTADLFSLSHIPSPTPLPMDVSPNPMDAPPNLMDMSPNPLDVPPNPLDEPPKPMDAPPNPVDMPPSPVDMSSSPMDVPPSPTDVPPNVMDVPPDPVDGSSEQHQPSSAAQGQSIINS